MRHACILYPIARGEAQGFPTCVPCCDLLTRITYTSPSLSREAEGKGEKRSILGFASVRESSLDMQGAEQGQR